MRGCNKHCPHPGAAATSAFTRVWREKTNSHLILRSSPTRQRRRASRRMAASAVPALVLRGAMLRMAPQDEGSETDAERFSHSQDEGGQASLLPPSGFRNAREAQAFHITLAV